MGIAKRILYIWKGEYPWDVRAEKVCETLAGAGYKVWMLARGGAGQPKREKIGNINIIRVGTNFKWALSTPIPFNPFWVKAIESAMDEVMPDLVIPREIMLAEDSAKIAIKRRVPVIMDMAENYPAAMRDWIKYNKTTFSRFLMHKAKTPDWVEKRSVKLMSGIFVVCHEQIDRLKRQFDYPSDSIAVVHNTPSLELIEGVRIGSDNPPLVLGHHGNMTAEKSLETLITGFNIAADTNPNISLYLAGEGESLPGYLDILSRLKHKDRISMPGKYLYSDLNDIMSRIDIGVVPYQVSDFNNYTIHNKIFDYWACGKPALVSENAPLKRLIDETGAGMAGDFSTSESAAEAILKICSSPNIIEMSSKALNASKNKYNWDVDSANLLEFVGKYI